MNRNKEKTRQTLMKVNGGGLSLLAFLSCFSVGFSSWITVSISSSDPVNINASVGDVKNTNFFTMGTVNMFSLGPDGMVKDNTIVSSSTIEAIFYIDNSLAYSSSNSGSLGFEVHLSCSDSIFLTSYISGPSIVNSTSVSSSVSGSDLASSVVYTISNSGTTEIKVIYAVKDTANSEGKYMADLYYSNKPTFSFSVRSN